MNGNISKIYSNDILHKYAEAYVLKKRKFSEEKRLSESKKLYVIYARKSTEDEKRQIESIEDQIDNCKVYANNNGLVVIEEVREEKSAKIAGKRKQFRKVLDTIQAGGSYNSILAWHPDRLARNMKESGEILDLLDKGVIADLKFSSYYFVNDTAGKMTLSILFAMAKEFSDKLSDDTIRGIKKKVLEGKYCGIEKRGYFHNKEGFFRKENIRFDIYQNAWKEYKNGKTQGSIRIELEKQGEILTPSKLSSFFQDPFYAGIYCFGKQIVDIKKVDSQFEPMVTAEDFIAVQRENRINPRGWKLNNEFKPFAQLVICADCGSYMVPGVSNGKGGKYLSITCGNGKCRKSRHQKNIRPIANTIRGKMIIDAAINFLQSNLDVNEKLYSKVRKSYFEANNIKINENKREIKNLRTKLSKLEEKENKINSKYLEEKEKEVILKLSNDLKIIINERMEMNKVVEKLVFESNQFEYELQIDFPPYNDFVNFFKNAITTLQETHDAQLIDNLVKLLFVNITVSDKEVLCYNVREPFKSYQIMKFLNGVDNGT